MNTLSRVMKQNTKKVLESFLSMSGQITKLWGGRFTGSIDPLMEIYNRTLPLGKLMYQEDLEGTGAHVSALNRAGILDGEDLALIVQGLGLIKTEWETETFVVKREDEDIHTANERRLTEIIGKEVGGKVHTGRSRNDQVSTDLRLYVRKHLINAREVLEDLILALTTRARKEIDVIMPGYTHLQRAQPIRWAHLLSSYATQLRDDLERLELVLKLTNRCPLGCGAIAGNPYPIDREHIANLLGFSDVIGNSLAVVGDRDFVTDTLYWGTSVSLHLSRMAEDLILYSTAEFGFIVLHDAFSTGSSLMPQKKNPDSLELIRGKCGRVFGNLAGFMMTIKGIPSSYNKDLAEDKRPLFDTLSTVKNSLQIFSRVISSLSINENNMRKALSADMLATDLADYLVKRGVPFRESHNIIGEVVKAADALGRHGIDKLSYEELVSVDPRFQEDVHRVFNFEASVEKRAVKGGTAKMAVIEQLDLIESDLKLRS